MYRHLLAMLIAIAPLSHAAGSIVNVQSAASKEAAEGLSGELSGAMNWTTGNTEITQISGSAGALYLAGRHRLFLTARASYGIEEGDTYVNNLFEHLRYRYQRSDWFAAETFLQHEYDEFRRLKLRALYGLGPRFDLPLPPGFELAIGSAWMLEFERYTEGDELDAGEEELNQRWSNYATGTVTLTEGIAISHTTYAQPKFDDFADYRILSETAAVLDVKSWLAVRMAFTAAYDSRPPEDVEELDTGFTTSLLFRL